MIYDTSIAFDKERAKTRFDWLVASEKVIDLKEKKAVRSLNQNNYLHLIMSWFGLEFGYRTEEVKQDIFKKEVNPDIFYEGEVGRISKVQRWRSSADLDSGEMTLAIDRFRDFSAQHGCYLPEPGDLVAMREMERQLSINKSKQYL